MTLTVPVGQYESPIRKVLIIDETCCQKIKTVTIEKLTFVYAFCSRATVSLMLKLPDKRRNKAGKSGIQVNIRSLRGQQSDREGANSLRQVKMSETGSHGSHRAPIQNRRKEAGINGSDFNSGGWIEAQSEGETSNNL
ncbi:hypothetical protein B9Z55_019646 [Caenorhabditis nigoni]|uniref:Uncharacterized protein n=1 Tax=Caenorhabditis nigoni TaxID=1611254 RepID=A0A2G5TJW0_9PELO|nr:hypothetical protein B9Z55_019646 [Caenorhabditis nigoni]